MGNTYVSVDGFIVHPRLPMSITDRYDGTDRRAINGILIRSIKTASRLRSWQITTERLNETDYNVFFGSILSYESTSTFVDQLGDVYTVALLDKTSALVRSDPDVSGDAEGTGATWYEVTFTIEETGQ